MALFSSLMVLVPLIHAEDESQPPYIEIRGEREAYYLVNDIDGFEKPYDYVIGETKNRLVEKIGIILLVASAGFAVVHGIGRILVSKKNGRTLELAGKERIYNLIIRCGHWLNAITILILILTGFRMHFFGASHKLGSLHNQFGYVFLLLYLLFLLYEFATSDYLQFISDDQDLREITDQVSFYAMGIFKGKEHPHHTTAKRKLNPLQKIAYFCVMFLVMPLIGCTGLILLRPDLMGRIVLLFGMENMEYVFLAHLAGAFCIAAGFLLGHIYLATTGDTVRQHFGAMITGHHKVFKHSTEEAD